MRQLQPYPGVRPHADDQTVKYALVQDASGASQPGVGERLSDIPDEFRSGTRVTPTSSVPPKATLPPESHVKNKAPRPTEHIITPVPSSARIVTPLPSNARIVTPLPSNARIVTPLPNVRIVTPLPSNARIITPLPRSEGRYATPSVSFAPPPKPISSAPAPSSRQAVRPRPSEPVRGPSLFVSALIALITIGIAAFVGASLGDGSLQRLWARSFTEAPKPAVAPRAKPDQATAAPVEPAPSPRPTPPSAEAATANASTPAVRFEDLPPLAPTSAAEPATAPPRPRPHAPHRR